MSGPSQRDRDLPSGLLKHIVLKNTVLPIVCALFTWILYLSYAVFKFDVLTYLKHGDQRPDPDINPGLVYLGIAIVVTVFVVPLCIARVRHALRLARHGVEVAAVITSVGKISAKGWVRVNYRYTFEGQTFDKAMSCIRDEANEYRTGKRQLVLLIDPAKPSRCMDRTDVLRS